MSDTMERTEIIPTTDDAEPGMLAHIIRKSDEMRGYALGEEVEALCGYRWVPTREPYQFPVCEECKAILAAMP